jgi:hypothetical protein
MELYTTAFCQSLRLARDRSLSLPEEKLLRLPLRPTAGTVSGRPGVDARELAGVSLTTRMLPVEEVDLVFFRRSLELAVLLPRRVRSDVDRSSRSGVGVELRDEALEWEMDPVPPPCRCLRSLL